MTSRWFSLILLASIVTASLRAEEITVFAAASLSDALREIAKTYETASGEKLLFNFAASSTLALQIKQGAPADLFFSADEAKMNELAKGGLIVAETRRSLLSNTLVIVINAEDGTTLAAPDDLAKTAIRRIALAEPQTVPAGIYAKEYLRKVGLWEKISDKLVPTENVRACLAAVEGGNADVGIVYKTDALISKKVKAAFEVPAGDAPLISYPAAVLKASKHADAARKFIIYLASPEASAVFTRYGFLPMP